MHGVVADEPDSIPAMRGATPLSPRRLSPHGGRDRQSASRRGEYRRGDSATGEKTGSKRDAWLVGVLSSRQCVNRFTLFTSLLFFTDFGRLGLRQRKRTGNPQNEHMKQDPDNLKKLMPVAAIFLMILFTVGFECGLIAATLNKHTIYVRQFHAQ